MLAFYADYGRAVEIWNADGTLYKTIKRDCQSLSICSQSLAFIDGDRKLLMGPSGLGSWSDMSKEERHALNDSLISIYTIENGDFRQVSRVFEEGSQVANSVDKFVVSPDNKYIAMSFTAPRTDVIEVYTVGDWKRIAVLYPSPIKGMIPGPMTFSPDGQTLAVVSYSRLDLYSTSSWGKIGGIEPFKTEWNKKRVRLGIGSIAISPDSTYIAVTSQGEGIKQSSNDSDRYDQRRDRSTGPINIYDLKTLNLDYYGMKIPSELSSLDHIVAWVSQTSLAMLSDTGCIATWNITGGDISLVFASRSSNALTFIPSKSLVAVTTANGTQLFKSSIK